MGRNDEIKAGRYFLFCHSEASSHPGQPEHGPVLVEAGHFPAAMAQIIVRKLTSQTLQHPSIEPVQEREEVALRDCGASPLPRI